MIFPDNKHKMSPRLEALIERARNHIMTPEEKFEQRVSFVYGQLMDSNNPPTKDEVRQRIIDAQGYPSKEHRKEV